MNVYVEDEAAALAPVAYLAREGRLCPLRLLGAHAQAAPLSAEAREPPAETAAAEVLALAAAVGRRLFALIDTLAAIDATIPAALARLKPLDAGGLAGRLVGPEREATLAFMPSLNSRDAEALRAGRDKAPPAAAVERLGAELRASLRIVRARPFKVDETLPTKTGEP